MFQEIPIKYLFQPKDSGLDRRIPSLEMSPPPQDILADPEGIGIKHPVDLLDYRVNQPIWEMVCWKDPLSLEFRLQPVLEMSKFHNFPPII